MLDHRTGGRMKGFGLRSFKKKEKTLDEKLNSALVDHFIYGDGEMAAWLYNTLKNLYPDASIKWCTHSKLAAQKKVISYIPSLLRENFDAFSLKGEFIDAPSLFYKNNQFQPFNSRVKPMSLSVFEKRFQQPFYKMISCDTNEVVDQHDESIKKESAEHQAGPISQKLSPDIKELDHFFLKDDIWGLYFKDQESLRAKKVYFLKDLKHLESLFKRNDIGYNFIAPEMKSALSLSWSMSHPVFDSLASLFVPLAMSQDKGYFIAEQSYLDENSYALNVLSSLEDDHDEQKVGQLISLIKRQLTKVFGDESFKALQDNDVLSYFSEFDYEIDDADLKAFKKRVSTLRDLGFVIPALEQTLDHCEWTRYNSYLSQYLYIDQLSQSKSKPKSSADFQQV